MKVRMKKVENPSMAKAIREKCMDCCCGDTEVDMDEWYEEL